MAKKRYESLGELLDRACRENLTTLTFSTNDAVWGGDELEIIPLEGGRRVEGPVAFPFGEKLRGEFFRRLDYPYRKLHSRLTQETEAALIGELVQQDCRGPKQRRRLPEAFRLILVDGTPSGLIPAQLHATSNLELVNVLRDSATTAKADLDSAKVRGSRLSPGEFHVRFTLDASAAEPQPGDIVAYGLSLQHSSAGLFPTRVEHFAHRLVCSNGMTAAVCLNDGRTRVRIRRGGEGGAEKTLRRVREALDQAFRTMSARMQATTELIEKRVDLRAAIDQVVSRNRWSRDVRLELLDGIERGDHGGDETSFGLVNLLSFVGTHGAQATGRRIPASVRDGLQHVAGVYAARSVHQCPTCRRVISGLN